MILLSALVLRGQDTGEFFDKVKQIRPLESSRDDVRRLLTDFNTNFAGQYDQTFHRGDIDVDIYYSDGSCSGHASEQEYSSLWNVEEWKVVRVEVGFGETITARELGIDTAGFVKEQTYRGYSSRKTSHNKDIGIAVETEDGEVQRVIYFPKQKESRWLCQNNQAGRSFYSRKSWFSKPLKDRFACILINQSANVDDMRLSHTELQASTGKVVSVATLASDPENDVLTYTYYVSAGKIVGTGAKVVWDLSGVPAGEYTILVGVDDGTGVKGSTVIRTVIIR